MAETEDKDDVVIMMEDNFDPDKGKQEISKAQEDRSSVARESKKSKKPNDEDVEKTSIRSSENGSVRTTPVSDDDKDPNFQTPKEEDSDDDDEGNKEAIPRRRRRASRRRKSSRARSAMRRRKTVPVTKSDSPSEDSDEVVNTSFSFTKKKSPVAKIYEDKQLKDFTFPSSGDPGSITKDSPSDKSQTMSDPEAGAGKTEVRKVISRGRRRSSTLSSRRGRRRSSGLRRPRPRSRFGTAKDGDLVTLERLETKQPIRVTLARHQLQTYKSTKRNEDDKHKIAKGYTIILAEYHFDFFSTLRFTAGPEDDSASDDNFLDESDDPDIQNNRCDEILKYWYSHPRVARHRTRGTFGFRALKSVTPSVQHHRRRRRHSSSKEDSKKSLASNAVTAKTVVSSS